MVAVINKHLPIIPIDDDNDMTVVIVVPIVGAFIVAVCIVLLAIAHKISKKKSRNSTSPGATNEEFDMKKQLSDVDDAANGGDDGSGS
uniref:Uncharacterized protein n=1 Tax=Amphimedon queenslandica TaxID=400682 RepID=A0A1X7SLM8_AMPQE